MAIGKYEELRVYQQAFAMAMDIFELSKSWPSSEKYALTDQIRRSSRSVCANLAEAWFKRGYPRHFVSKLSDAGSEVAETMIWLDFAVACRYLDTTTSQRLKHDYNHIAGGLVKMMNHPEQWCLPNKGVREPGAEYHTENTDDMLGPTFPDSPLLRLSDS